MDAVLDNLDFFRSGFWVTLQLSLLSYAGALALGTLLAVMRVSPVAPLRAAGLTYVETVRNTPLAVLFVMFYFGFPKLGFRFSSFAWAVIVLVVYHAAFVTEAVRSGINTVAAGQAEAARSIGLTFGQTLRFVVLPQALRAVVVPLGNIFIALAKNSAVAATISVYELTLNSSRLIRDESHPVEILLFAAACYMVITLSASALLRVLERRTVIAR